MVKSPIKVSAGGDLTIFRRILWYFEQNMLEYTARDDRNMQLTAPSLDKAQKLTLTSLGAILRDEP